MSCPGTLRWFGKSWGAPANHPECQIDTPVGIPCWHCTEHIEEGDRGFRHPAIALPKPYVYYHAVCHLAEVVGEEMAYKIWAQVLEREAGLRGGGG